MNAPVDTDPRCPWCGCWWHVSPDGALCESPERDPDRSRRGATACRAALHRADDAPSLVAAVLAGQIVEVIG